MKNKILTAIAVMASLCGYAQTKGTNALSFGVSVNKVTTEQNVPDGLSSSEAKNNNFGLGYGLFIKDNAKLGVEFLYSVYESKLNASRSEQKGYGANATYQQYYPILKKLYAYAGGKLGYLYTKQEFSNGDMDDLTGNQYQLGAYGGVTWFLSKRFALETSLLSADINYATSDQKGVNGTMGYKQKSTSFSFSSKGFINDLGFKIYLLF